MIPHTHKVMFKNCSRAAKAQRVVGGNEAPVAFVATTKAYAQRRPDAD